MESNNAQSKTKKMVRKPGRTILVRSQEPVLTESLVGLQSSTQSNDNQFLVFDTVENSKNAFKILRQNQNYRVKFAHYRVFFTMTGLTDNDDYGLVKKDHINWVTLNSSALVLYYKQYKKGSQYLGCGDFTIDTKESLDELLNKDGGKTFSFGKYTGINYRYNKRDNQSTLNET
jgi:hypothetical protein